MRLDEALNVSRIAVLEKEGATYYATHTACYKQEGKTSIRIDRMKKVAVDKGWKPMGTGAILQCEMTNPITTILHLKHG